MTPEQSRLLERLLQGVTPLDRILAARKEAAARYSEILGGLDVELPLADDADHERSWFVYVVKLPAGVDRDALALNLVGQGIACAPYLPSIHLQPYMRERFGFSEGLCPVSEDCSSRTLAIPFHARIPREDQERVAAALAAALEAAYPQRRQLHIQRARHQQPGQQGGRHQQAGQPQPAFALRLMRRLVH